MLTESCCFLSLEVESFVQAATKKPVWEGMQGACAMQESSNVEQGFPGQGTLGGRVHALTVP